MIPPSWVLADATRLDLAEFGAQFAAAWSGLTSRFLKLECWQRYQELEANTSQAAFDRGDLTEAEKLLRREAEADRPLYDDVRARGLDYARIRLAQEPLTDYLRYEQINYRIRAAMGENIEVVSYAPDLPLPNDAHFDFLLFDQTVALIHDYGTGEVGHQTGGWLTHQPQTLQRLEVTALELRARAKPWASQLTN